MATTNDSLEELIPDAEVRDNVRTMIGALSIMRGATPDDPMALELGRVSEAALVILAAIVEIDPSLDTPGKRRAEIDELRSSLKQYLAALTAYRVETGLSVLHSLGLMEGEPFTGVPESSGEVH